MNATSKEVSALISDQNEVASRLGLSVHYYQPNNNPASVSLPPPGFEHELVEFSRRNATLIYTADRLSIPKSIKHFFVSENLMHRIHHLQVTDGSDTKIDHFTINPTYSSVSQLAAEGEYQIRLYQAIRDQAQDLSGTWQGLIAGITTYLLPVLYAVLGAFLYTFRSWHRSEKYQSPDCTSRVLMAGIAGIAIGALNDLFPKELLFSPLAMAFIAGYSIDVLTSRLDTLIHALSKTPVKPSHASARGDALEPGPSLG
jgi:hypothetical protein